MLTCALLFFSIALVGAALGFPGITGVATGIARQAFYVFMILCCVAMMIGLSHGGGG